MTQLELKKATGWAALEFIEEDSIVGVGTGSTVHHFIDALATIKHKIEGVVSSSDDSTQKLKHLGIPILDLNQINQLPVYVDGADEINHRLEMIKGGGAALTREKIIAAVAQKFICIADESKYVKHLGEFPLPIEVIPMARSYVAREIVKLGGSPVYRENVTTDNHNVILDVYNLNLMAAFKVEEQLNQIAGVVTHGIFAQRHADILLLGTSDGVQKVTKTS